MKSKLKDKKKSEIAKISSSLMKDIARIRKTCLSQTRMNTLRKHQIKLLNEFLNKLMKEGRIAKDELKAYMPKKKEAEKKLLSS